MIVRASLLIALAGCDWDFNRMNDSPRCEPGDSRPWLEDRRCDQRPPEGVVAWRERVEPPPEVNRELIVRGRDRFSRMCAPCHGTLGDGDSITARDMVLRPPPSLLTPLVREYTDQRLFDVITRGYGLMPAYTYQLAPRDRWAVVHYVRVLQRRHEVPLAELSSSQREEAMRWLR